MSADDPGAGTDLEALCHQMMVECPNVAMCLLDASGVILSWNRGATAIFGYPADAVQGRTLDPLFPQPGAGAGPPAAWLARAAETSQCAITADACHADGAAVRVELNLAALRTSAGRLKGFGLVALDRTRQEQTHKALMLSEQRFRTLFEQSPLPIEVFAPDGTIRAYNRAADQLWRIPPEQISTYSLLDDKQLKQTGLIALVHQAIEDRCPVTSPPLYWDPALRGFTGRARWIRAFLYPVLDAAGQIAELVLILDDVTDLQEVTTQLERVLQGREEFLTLASHELKTPLTSLRLMADLLVSPQARDMTPDQVQEALQMLRRQAVRLTDLTRTLLDIEQLEAGRLALSPRAVTLNAVVERTVERFAGLAEQAGCELQVLPRGIVTGHWDDRRLEQVIASLVSNAVKFGAGGLIEVRFGQEGDRAWLQVRDSGIGIAKADQGRIFDRFERLVSSRHFGGFGLGLWFTRRLVSAMGGTIDVTSRPGTGSTFSITLPLGQPPDTG